MAQAYGTTGFTQIGTSATSCTIDISAATDGDWVYAGLFLTTTQTGVTWTGWTQVLEGDQGTASHYAIFRRKKQAGDTTFSISWPTSHKGVLVWVSFSGLDATTPDELAGFLATGSTTVTTPSITPNAADRWALTFFFNRSTTTGQSAISFSGYTSPLVERQDQNTGSTATRFMGGAAADSNGVVTQAAHAYSATSTFGSNGGGILLYLIPASGGTSRTLDGAGKAATKGSASLAGDRPIAGTGTAATIASGVLGKTRALDASGTAATRATAEVNTARLLTGQGSAATGTSASLTTAHTGAVALDGAGSSATKGTAGASITRPVAGSGTSATRGAGSAVTTRPIAGAARSATKGTADLTVTGPGGTSRDLAGAARAATSGQGSLTRIRGLQGIGAAATGATGVLGKTRPLAAAGKTATGAAGVLGKTRALAGAGVAATGSIASLTVAVRPTVTLQRASGEFRPEKLHWYQTRLPWPDREIE